MVKSKPTPTSEIAASNAETSARPSSPRRSRSAPSPLNSAEQDDLDRPNPSAKTPVSILKSGRYRIEVKRTGKNEDGFADDSPYWEAAKRASTQDSQSSSSESDREEEEEVKLKQKADPKTLKRKEKQKLKKNELEKLREKYEQAQGNTKPNFKVGTSSQSESSDYEDGGESDTGEWLKTSLQRNGNKTGSGKFMLFSPSDLSRASTIPPTPASTKESVASMSSSKKTDKGKILITSDNEEQEHEHEQQQDIEHEEQGNNDDFYVTHHDDDDIDDDDNHDSNDETDDKDITRGPLSPIHEEHVAKKNSRSTSTSNDHIQELEDNIMEVAEKASMANQKDNLPLEMDTFPMHHDDGDSDGAGDDDGVGFELANQQTSPQSTSEGLPSSNVSEHSSDVKSKFSNNKKKQKRKEETTVESVTPDASNRSMKRKRGRTKKVRISNAIGSRGYQVAPREYRTIPAEEFEDHNDDAPEGVRRSKRRRFRPLQFWRNEKLVYGPNSGEGDLAEIFGDMPIVAGVQEAQPTPYKKRTVARRIQKKDDDSDDEEDDDDNSKKKEDAKKKSKKGWKTDIDEEPFDSTKLRRKYNIEDGDTAPIWWESKGLTLDKKVLCYRQNIKLHELPLSKKRSKKDGTVVAKAAQAFNIEPQEDNMPGYICGCMDVPPLGIKDEEGVGPCSQVFNVGDCQPKSVELAIAHPDVNGGNFDADSAIRFLLSKGDMFHIPAGNVYRIQNHSKTTVCTLNWTIIRPPPREEE